MLGVKLKEKMLLLTPQSMPINLDMALYKGTPILMLEMEELPVYLI